MKLELFYRVNRSIFKLNKTILSTILVLILSGNISFAQDTMYVYKSGAVVSKIAVDDIDTMYFYKYAADNESLSRLYLSFAVSHPTRLVDYHFSNYIRLLWNLEEITTDEVKNAWSDAGISGLNFQDFRPDNYIIYWMYSRIFYEINICNKVILATQEQEQTDDVKIINAEARFLRALAYSHALDLFGTVPFITETETSPFPQQISRTELFTYIESDLKAIENELAEPRTQYSRADKASCWTLLAKNYLNAEVYTGVQRYTDCLTYVNKVLEAGYSLNPEYKNNFLADNNTSSEIIFAIPYDVNQSTYGGTNYIIHSATGGTMDPASLGIDGGWAGNRATLSFYNKFSDPSGTTDKRPMFWTSGQTLEFSYISPNPPFTVGIAVMKFKNITSTGAAGSSPFFVDTDFPIYRLADIYLIYAECVLRGGSGGDINTALTYVNALRQRAYGNTSGNITSSELTLDFILDERARELYWEAQRRTDLIRFEQFTNGTYTWDLKGGVVGGTQTQSYMDVFPIPAYELNINPNLIQNAGY